MITVKLFGLLRLESGIKELHIEADNVKSLFKAICSQTDKVSLDDLNGCIITINGNQGNKRSTLHDGDVVILMSPVAGG